MAGHINIYGKKLVFSCECARLTAYLKYTIPTLLLLDVIAAVLFCPVFLVEGEMNEA